MPRKKKAPEKRESKPRERSEKKMPVKNQAELTERDLESVSGGAVTTGLQNPLLPVYTVFYY